jgi:hypothetical protein
LIKDDARPGFYESGRFFYEMASNTFLLTKEEEVENV